MKQVTNAPLMKLEHHLSASQYTQHLVSTLGVKQLRLCEKPVQQQPIVAAFCVDHQLRPESTHECQQAANQASAMGLESNVMQMYWPQLPATGHLMEQASIMRYQLLQQVCKAHHISVLLSGHHAGMHQKCKCLYAREFPISGCAARSNPFVIVSCPLCNCGKHQLLSCHACLGDQAETFMMRVTRGSGISGLAGIAEASWVSLGNSVTHNKLCLLVVTTY